MSPVAKSLEIGDELRALCMRFGVEYDSVLKITVTPSAAEVVIAKRNEGGRFYVENDGMLPSSIR